jgi:hypothetical protein
MATVSQRIPNFLGGVSTQPDNEKEINQVSEIINGYTDLTLGLHKRSGTRWIADLANGVSTALFPNAKWFYIDRHGLAPYIGCIPVGDGAGDGGGDGGSIPIKMWNANTGDAVTVTNTTVNSIQPLDYLTATKTVAGSSTAIVPKEDYDVLTIQDTTIITNKTVTVDDLADPSFTSNRNGTIRILLAKNTTQYSVRIKVGSEDEVTTTYTSDGSATIEEIAAGLLASGTNSGGDASGTDGLNGVKADGDEGFTNFTFTDCGFGVINVAHSSSDFTLEFSSGDSNTLMEVYKDEIQDISSLTKYDKDGRTLRVTQTAGLGDKDDYYVKFALDSGYTTVGKGTWQETTGFTTSTGFNPATMPHELVYTGVNAFTFRPITWTARLAGTETTNPMPSFKGSTIQEAFFSSNRLGFLSEDNVIMSQTTEYYNFFKRSAQTSIDSDPIDINASSIRPCTFHAVIPKTQGLLLFSTHEQFLLANNDGSPTFSPNKVRIRSLSSFEMDKNVDPVDAGDFIAFISKTPSYTRVYAMITQGNENNAQIADLGMKVNEWIPDTVDSVSSSTQNNLLILSSQTSEYVYFYRARETGTDTALKSWFRWQLPGPVRHITIQNDEAIVVCQVVTTADGADGGSDPDEERLYLCKINLNTTPEQLSLVDADGNRINPCIDLYKESAGITSNGGAVWSSGLGSGKMGTRVQLPYKDAVDKTPVIVIKSGGSANSTPGLAFGTEGIELERGEVDGNDYFFIPNVDLVNGVASDGSAAITLHVAADVIVGYKYNYEVELPRYYFRNEAGTDYTASLVLARMKFAVGKSGQFSFKMKAKGEDEYSTAIAATSADQYKADEVPITAEAVYTVPLHQRPKNFTLKVFDDGPFPLALTSMTWEGNYTPRYYRRS